MVSIPDDLLQQIDQAAAAQGKTRSRFLQEAAREALSADDDTRWHEAFAKIRELAKEGRPLGDTAALIRHERDHVLP